MVLQEMIRYPPDAVGLKPSAMRSEAHLCGLDRINFWKTISVADFQVDFARMTCTCPGGQVSTTSYASGNADGITFRFWAPDCAGCDEYAQCRDPKAKSDSHRTVFISEYHHHMREARRVNQSDEGKALLHDRWRVEPTIAWLTRYQGCRRARCIGLAAAQFEL
ncbi:MAG: hypothetical protein EOM24_28150, partial [Chloroflexia bacterium]|nr:hypothetical protein [Chloroflexia bacterium]